MTDILLLNGDLVIPSVEHLGFCCVKLEQVCLDERHDIGHFLIVLGMRKSVCFKYRYQPVFRIDDPQGLLPRHIQVHMLGVLSRVPCMADEWGGRHLFNLKWKIYCSYYYCYIYIYIAITLP